jgi:hypothetical protein
MRTSWSRAAAAAATLFGAACGATAPPAPPVVVAQAQPVAPAAPVGPDLSSVPEPRALTLLARLHNPIATAAAVGRSIGYPFDLGALLRSLSDKQSDVLKLDAAVDFAVALDPSSTDEEPKFFGAVSVPVRSLEEARAVLARETMTQIRPGVYRETLRSGSDPDDEGFLCDLAASVGDAPARLVCGQAEADLDALGPWLARGMPMASFGRGDLHVQLRARPLQERYGSLLKNQADLAAIAASAWLSTEAGVQDPRLLSAPGSVLAEGVGFVQDMDALTIDGVLDASGGTMTLEGTLRMRSSRSWLTRLLTDRNDRAGAPPPIFWQAPRESDSASFGRGQDPKLFEGIRRTLELAMSTALTKAKVPAADRKPIEEWVASMPLADAAAVAARGPVRSSYKPKPPAQRKPADAIEQARAFVNGYLGWYLVGVDTPAAPHAAWLRKTADACAAAVRQLKAHKGPGKLDKDDLRWVPTMKVVSAPAGFPKEAVALELSVDVDSRAIWEVTGHLSGGVDVPPHPEGPAAKGKITLHMVVVPDGPGRSWMGYSADAETLRKRMAAALSGAPREGTIAAMPGLEPLRTPASTWAGFVIYGSMLDGYFDLLRGGHEPAIALVEQAMKSAPNRFNTPLLVIGSGTAGAAPSTTVRVRMQKGTLDDIGALVRFLTSEKGRKLIDAAGLHPRMP